MHDDRPKLLPSMFNRCQAAKNLGVHNVPMPREGMVTVDGVQVFESDRIIPFGDLRDAMHAARVFGTRVYSYTPDEVAAACAAIPAV